MKLLELKKGLEETVKIPVYYGGSLIRVKAPYIVLVDMGENHLYGSDDIVHDTLDVDIEIYSDKKDLALEKKVKDFLKANQLLYEKGPDIIIESGFLNTTFEIEIEAN